MRCGNPFSFLWVWLSAEGGGKVLSQGFSGPEVGLKLGVQLRVVPDRTVEPSQKLAVHHGKGLHRLLGDQAVTEGGAHPGQQPPDPLPVLSRQEPQAPAHEVDAAVDVGGGGRGEEAPPR